LFIGQLRVKMVNMSLINSMLSLLESSVEMCHLF
jgi:hypothetical protein